MGDWAERDHSDKRKLPGGVGESLGGRGGEGGGFRFRYVDVGGNEVGMLQTMSARHLAGRTLKPSPSRGHTISRKFPSFLLVLMCTHIQDLSPWV